MSSVKKNDTTQWGNSFFEYEIQKFPEKRLKGKLFVEIINSTVNGTSSPLVGFIVKVKDPHSNVIFQELGQGHQPLYKLGESRILNYKYKGTGVVFGRFTILDKGNNHWDILQFKITIIKDNSTPGALITNVNQRKVVGMASEGKGSLDVAFSISTGRTLKHIQWIFGDEEPPIPIQKPNNQVLEYATTHTYRNAKPKYDASVTVWDHQGNKSKTKYFPVIMAEL